MLEMTRLGIAESVESSAVVVKGEALFANSTFVNCAVRLNALSENGQHGVSRWFHSCHTYVGESSGWRTASCDGTQCATDQNALEGRYSFLSPRWQSSPGPSSAANMAMGGRISAYGAAVHVRDNSSLRMERSRLAGNVADGNNMTSIYAAAGAIYIDGDSVAARVRDRG